MKKMKKYKKRKEEEEEGEEEEEEKVGKTDAHSLRTPLGNNTVPASKRSKALR